MQLDHIGIGHSSSQDASAALVNPNDRRSETNLANVQVQRLWREFADRTFLEGRAGWPADAGSRSACSQAVR